jgi:anti-sigma regulatory factor (Ser/Thr protein kinase)
MPMRAALERTLPAVPESIHILRHAAVRAYEDGGGDRALSADIALGVTEACANAIRHAYPEQPDGRLTVRGWFEDGLFVIQVLDRGVGIDTPTRSPGAHLGVALIEQLADAEFSLREGGGTEARLAFPLQATDPPAARPVALPAVTILQLTG